MKTALAVLLSFFLIIGVPYLMGQMLIVKALCIALSASAGIALLICAAFGAFRD
jgi:hypothetical protein